MIKALNKLRDEDTEVFLMENLYMFNRLQLNIIEKETGLKIVDGMDVLMGFLSLALTSIYKILGEDLKNREALIIGREEELTQKAIEAICKDVSFITIIGDFDKEDVERIYQHVLEKTGLSIFFSKKIDRILTNYSIIINLIDNCSINTRRLRNDAIIFDFSIDKQFSRSIIKDTKLTVVEDFVFRGDGINLNGKGLIPTLVPSYIYEYLAQGKDEDFYGVYANGNIYSTAEFVHLNIKNKGKF